jgi:hypothetical protein
MNASPEGDVSGSRLQRQYTFLPAATETPHATYPTLLGVVAAVAALYFGRDIFIPLAIAVLLTFTAGVRISSGALAEFHRFKLAN